jgi:outer membrane biosynthesis protein TonB
MRLRAGVAAAVAVGLLALIVPGAAHAAAPGNEVFYPAGQEPKPEPEQKPDAKQNEQAEPAEPAPAGDADLSAMNDREREAAHARGSRMAVDLMGWMPSLYQGKWFMPGREDVRRCILDRESNFNYRATSGTYHGAYQMSAPLARGATWMMQPEVRREMGAEGVAIVEALRKITPNRWNRYWQDRAFWTIWRNGNGASHWHGGC